MDISSPHGLAGSGQRVGLDLSSTYPWKQIYAKAFGVKASGA